MSATRPHFKAFDGVRALAIVPVLWHHSTPRLLPGVLGKGAVGVDLFFALSGFLITSLLLAERRERASLEPGPPIDLVRFHGRRFSRLLPLYVLVLTIHAVALVVAKPEAPQTAHYLAALPAHLTFTSNWFVNFDVPHPVTMAITWSLAVEMQFYVLLSLLFRFARPAWGIAAAVAGLALFDLAIEHRVLAADFPRSGVAFRILSSAALPLLLGTLLALLDGPTGTTSLRAAKRALAHPASPPLLLAGAGWCLAQLYTPYVALSLCLALFVGSVAKNDGGVLAPLLTWPPMVHLGRASYAVYLTHLGPLALVRTALPASRENPLLLFGLTLPIAWLVGEASRGLVEVPARDWLRRHLRATDSAVSKPRTGTHPRRG